MIILDEYKVKIANLKKDIEELGRALGISSLRDRVAEIEKITAEPGFWDDMENSQKILVEQKQIKDKIEKYEKLISDADDAATMVEMAMDKTTTALTKKLSRR